MAQLQPSKTLSANALCTCTASGVVYETPQAEGSPHCERTHTDHAHNRFHALSIGNKLRTLVLPLVPLIQHCQAALAI